MYGYTCTNVSHPFTAGTLDMGNHSEDGLVVWPLPFSFQWYGEPYTAVNVGANGNLQFGSADEAWDTTLRFLERYLKLGTPTQPL